MEGRYKPIPDGLYSPRLIETVKRFVLKTYLFYTDYLNKISKGNLFILKLYLYCFKFSAALPLSRNKYLDLCCELHLNCLSQPVYLF